MGKLARERDRIALAESQATLASYRAAFAHLSIILDRRPRESLLTAANRMRAERDALRTAETNEAG